MQQFCPQFTDTERNVNQAQGQHEFNSRPFKEHPARRGEPRM